MPAEQVVLTLPPPDGTLPLPGPGALTPPLGWRWELGHLDESSSTSVSGALRLVRMPHGQALLLHPHLSASDVSWPIETLGGALVRDPRYASATGRFTPGRPMRLRSGDGRVQVDFPARAATRR